MTRAVGEQFDMGRVFTGTIAAISGNWMPILAITVISGVISVAANSLTMGEVARGRDAFDVMSSLSAFFTLSLYFGWLGSLLITSFAQASIIRLLFARAEDTEAPLAPILIGAVRMTLPLTALTILWWVGVSIGFVLFFVPGVILITMWSVCVPVLIGERTGVIAAFGRSRALTKGVRWTVFATLLLFALGLIFVSTAFQGFSTTGLMQLYQSNVVLARAVAILLFAVQTMFLTAFLFALYIELNRADAAKTPASLADIFS